ncbi:leucine-rich repeat flightless-interacting protein 1 isoform X2 [Archocentrus centrarchus]|uniref:leucine-rich repeat flightless-interacting protein 1 isoform X2 n=1 Tax=Archocentrus centrarchus TaxID=63155 RepID=UPI0011EA4EF9|nr:leucine-rich repeat flightless-interacting protein 1-like isoform X2 [Archocentrus centrarchus]
MHSVTLDSSGSPKKRSFSRGVSEDESLRSIIKETDSSSRRVTRSDSRAGTLKRRSDSQSDQDIFMGLPEMLELQASYEEAVQELRGLEVEREALLFQVDVLQDTLEGVEELLAEAQREAGQASLELEREKEAKRKLESMVHSLMQEVERLKEERNNQLPGPGSEMDKTTNHGHQVRKDAHEVLTVESSSTSHESHSSDSSKGVLATTMERGQNEGTEEKQWRMVNKLMGHQPSLALNNLVSEEGVLRRSYENGAAEGRDASPDRNDSDSISAYEDASADTPEQHRIFPGDGDTLELPHDSENSEKNLSNNGQPLNSETQGPKNNESCVVS